MTLVEDVVITTTYAEWNREIRQMERMSRPSVAVISGADADFRKSAEAIYDALPKVEPPMPTVGEVEIIMHDDVVQARKVYDQAKKTSMKRGKSKAQADHYALREVMLFSLKIAAINLGVK